MKNEKQCSLDSLTYAFWNANEDQEILKWARKIIELRGFKGSGWYKFAIDARPTRNDFEVFFKVIYVFVDLSENVVSVRRFDKGDCQKVTDESFIFEAGRTNVKKYLLTVPDNLL